MALTSRLSKLLVHEFNLTSYLREAGDGIQVDVHDCTVWGQTSRTYVPGLADGTLNLQGFFEADNVANDRIDNVLKAALGAATPRIVTWGVDGFAVAKRVNLLQAEETSYERTSPVGDLVTVSAAFQADGGIDGGVALHDLTAETATANGTAVDNGAATSAGGVAHLHVTAAAGTTPTLAVKVQHSVDAVTWTDLVTFTVTSVKTAERLAIGGTVNRHVRAVWTIGGTTPSFTFAVAFARR